MLGRMIVPEYLDLGSLVIDVHFNLIIVRNTLIQLGATINIMTKDTMLKLNLQYSPRKATTMLQHVDRSIMEL